ncbi:LamG domain-containing protein [Nostoc sp.]
MEISKLKTLTIPTLNDIIPILDIDGGISGKPILRKVSVGTLLELVNNENHETENTSGFIVPTIVKTVAANTDYFIGIDTSGTAYKITKENLLAGLSNSGSTNGNNSGGNSNQDPYFSNVSLLLPFNGNFTDIKGNIVTSSGDVNIASSGQRWGSGSISFFGNGGNLAIPNSNAFNLTGRDFTIECWINTTNTSNAYHTIVDKYDSSGSVGSFQLTQVGSRIEFWYASYSGSVPLLSSANGSISTGNWYFISVTRSGNVFKLYIDGVEVATANYSPAGFNPNIPVNIGSQANAGNWFFGKIDDVRITVDVTRIPNVPTQEFPHN